MILRMTVAGALLALVACGSDGGPADGASPSPPLVRPSSTGSIAIVEPTPGQVVEGEVRVRVELTGATLVEEVSTDLAPDEGHIHLSLDGETVTLLGSLDEVIPGVAPGPHLLEVEFVAADHGPFNPRVLQTVSFEAA
ncbi:MAG TPA: hypothetical protein VGB28_08025 [Actinomycetota bacterium]|jgi:hypothetical protein